MPARRFELHPADRRLLQGEVARTFASPQPQHRSFARVLARLWPRLAGAVALLAILGLAVWTLLPVPRNNTPELSLARNLPASKDMLAQEPQPPAAPRTAPLAAPPTPEVKKESQLLAFADKQKPAAASPPVRLTETASPVAEDNSVAQRQTLGSPRLELAVAPSPAHRPPAAKLQVAASDGVPAQAPASAAGGAFAQRYGLPAQPATPASSPASPSAPATVAMTPVTAGVPLADEPANLFVAPTGQPAAPPAAQPNESAQLAAGSSAQPGTYFKSLSDVAAANRPSPSPLASDSLSTTVAGTLEGANALTAAQRFVQVPSEAKIRETPAVRGAVTPAVLASFQVEQAGPALRIVDGDGSVYTGSLQLAPATRRTRSSNANAPAATYAARAPVRALQQATAFSLDSDALAPQTYAFRVAGTNRSLQKKVVFTGNLLTTTNLILSLDSATNFNVGASLGKADSRNTLSYGASNLSTGRALGGSQNPTPQPAFLPLLNSRISGKVVIGGGKPTEINALPASP